MKKGLVVGSAAVAGVFLFPVVGNAESVTQGAEVMVADGNITLEVPSGLVLSFQDLEYGGYRQDKYFHPVVKPVSFCFGIFTETGFASDNPYDDIEVHPPTVYGNPMQDAIVKITNKNSTNPEFKIAVQRTGFFHRETGEEMTGVHLYMGNFKDGIDYAGASRANTRFYNPSAIEGTDTYWLARYLTIEEETSSLVADYRGKSGLGEHFISPFTPSIRNSDGTISIQPAYYESYSEENISLGVDSYTKIPAAGAYTTTLTWSIEQTP